MKISNIKLSSDTRDLPPLDLISESDGTSTFPPLDLISESDGSSDNIYSRFFSNAVTLSYPTNRLNLFEQIANNNMMDSMYKDNVLFTAYNIDNDRRRSTMLGNVADVVLGNDNYGLNTNTIANIMMPRSNNDIDEHTHEFVTSEESLLSRGNGNIGNAIGSGIATMASDIFDNITKGFFADVGEAIGTPTRATYKGAGHRTKTFSWEVSPRNIADLVSLIDIIYTFSLLSYGTSGNSQIIGSVIDTLKNGIREHYSGYNTNGITLTSEQIVESFRYVKVMKNPTLWYIRNYNHKSLSAIGDNSIFGPANITNIKVNHTPDGHFQGFIDAPNLSVKYHIEITFREAISHTQDTIGQMLNRSGIR